MTLKDFTFGSPQNLTMTVEESGGGGGSSITLYVDSVNGDDANEGTAFGAGTALATIGEAWSRLPTKTNGLFHTIRILGDFNIATDTILNGVFDGKEINGGRITIESRTNYDWSYVDLGSPSFTVAAVVDNFSFTVTGGGMTPEAHVGKWVGDPYGTLIGGYYDIKLVQKNTADTIWTNYAHGASATQEMKFWRQNGRITSNVEFDIKCSEGGFLYFHDVCFNGTDKDVVFSGNGYYKLEDICASEAFTQLIVTPDTGCRINMALQDNVAFMRTRNATIIGGTDSPVQARDTDFDAFGNGVFMGPTRFTGCRFLGGFYGGTLRRLRWANPLNSVSYTSSYVVRMIDCSTFNQFHGTLEWWWIENNHATPDAGAALQLEDSSMTLGEGMECYGGNAGIRLIRSELRLDTNYTPYPTGSGVYGVHAAYGSQVRVTYNSANNPLITGTTADVAVGSTGAGTSTWAAIMGGTPVADTTEMCFARKDGADITQWYY